ncbi:hypothetical protein GGU11DRAFT_880852 [Lentinula aff. detonsa]|nr:hypothetical protein GGU11DRAFT_880852 [Lentinula aff. detonsa]
MCTTVLANDKEEEELQAFLVVAQGEAHEKWEKLRSEKDVEQVIKEGAGNAVINVKGVEQEVVPKIEPPSKKLVTCMVAMGPCSREVVPIIPIPKKHRVVVDPEVAESSRKRLRLWLILILIPSLLCFLTLVNIAFGVTRSVDLNPTLPMWWPAIGVTSQGRVVPSSGR